MEPTNFSEPGSDEALMNNQVSRYHNMTEPRRIVAGIEVLKRLQRRIVAELDALLPRSSAATSKVNYDKD